MVLYILRYPQNQRIRNADYRSAFPLDNLANRNELNLGQLLAIHLPMDEIHRLNSQCVEIIIQTANPRLGIL